MHNGPSTQTPRTAGCCAGRAQVVALTRKATPGWVVELVRCSDCGGNTWRLEGAEVGKEAALAALSEAFISTASRPPRPVRAYAAR